MAQERNRCGRLERGEDCSFDEKLFYIIILAVFAVTMFLFIYQAWVVRRKDASGLTKLTVMTRPQLSLLFAAGSTFCIFLDTLVVLGDLGDKVVRGDHEFSFFGSMLLFFALLLFAQRWCHVVQGLEKRLTRDGAGKRSRKVAIAAVLCGYWCMAIAHVPMVVFRVVEWPDWELAVTLFAVCVIVEAVLLSLLGLLMCVVAFTLRAPDITQPKTKKSISQLRWVTALNFIEQLVFDVALIVIHRLYFSDNYIHHGRVQAAYFILWFAVYWSMHFQILIFFRFVTLSDEHEIGLLCEECDGEDQHDGDLEKNVSEPSLQAVHGKDSAMPQASMQDIISWADNKTGGSPPLATATAMNGVVLGSPILEDATPITPREDVSNPLDVFQL